MTYYPPSSAFDAPAGPANPSAPLRIAVLAVFWLAAAASAAVTVATVLRRGAWKDSLDAGTAATDDLTGRDAPVIIAVFVLTMVVVTGAIAVAVWTLRLVTSAQARGVTELSPGWAVGGWFVPVGFLVLGFRQVARAVAGVGGSTSRVLWWQISFAVVVVVMAVAQFTSRDISAVPTKASISALTRESVLSGLGTLCFVAAAVFGTLAITHADRVMDDAVTV